MNPELGKAALSLALVLVGTLVMLAGIKAPILSGPILVLAIAVIALELSAPSHRIMGRASGVFPCYILLALLPGSSPAVALVVALVALAARMFLSGQDRLTSIWQIGEFAIDALATCASLLALKFLLLYAKTESGHFLIGLSLICVFQILLRSILVQLWQPEISADEARKWATDQANIASVLALTSLAAVPYGLLAQQTQEFAYLAPLGSLFLARSLAPIWDSEKDSSKIRLSHKLERANTYLADTQQENIEIGEQLQLKRSDLEFIQELARKLPYQTAKDEVLREILSLASRVSQADSVVLCLEEDGVLEATAIKGDGELGHDLSLVRRAYKLNRIEFGRTERKGEFLFSQDKSALALPIRRYGSIYLGRRIPMEFEDSVISKLTILSQQAFFAVQTAEFSEAREQALESESREKERAELVLSGVNSMVRLMDDLMKLDDPEEIIKRIRLKIGQLLPADDWLLALPDGLEFDPLPGPGGLDPWDLDSIFALGREIQALGLPINETELKTLGLSKSHSNFRSLLACPVPIENSNLGFIVATSNKPNAFERRHQELLLALSYQFGSHYGNTVLRQEINQAHGKLETTHKRLKESQAHLVHTSKLAAVGRLAAGVSHEFNTPLGAIRLSLESAIRVLRKKPDSAEKKLTRSLQSVEQLTELVDKLLHYSNSSPGEVSQLDPRQLIRDTLKLIRGQISPDIEVQINLEKSARILVNHSDFQQCLINLINNALDAFASQKTKKPILRVQTTQEQKSLIILIEDNGPGMKAEVLARAFEPFFSLADFGNKTGLGLSVTRQLAEKYQGSVELESEPERGTSARLIFPTV